MLVYLRDGSAQTNARAATDKCTCCHRQMHVLPQTNARAETEAANRGFPTRMVYLYYISCLRYTILVGNPRNQTYCLTQSHYTDTGPTSPSTDPITPGAWQGRHWGANFEVTGMTRPGKIPSQKGFEPQIFRSRGGRLNI